MELEDDRRRLFNTTDSLNKLKVLLGFSSENCLKMVETLTQFDDRLSKLEETVQPVYKETGNLQRQQENINSTLNRLDYVIKFYTVAGEVEPNIINGPGSSSMYSEYIRDLNRLTEAVRYFELNNPESPELMNCSSLLEKGGQIIEKEFRQNMSRHSEEIKKVDIILDMIKTNDFGDISKSNEDNCKAEKANEQLPLESSFENVYKIFKLSDRRNGNPEKIIFDLKILSEWLCLNRNQDFILLYSRLRSEVLIKSLKNLRSYLKSSTLGTMIKGLGSHLSPLLGGRKNLHLMKTIDCSYHEMNIKNRGSLMRRIQDVSMEMFGGNSMTTSRSIQALTSPSTSIGDLKELDLNITEREIFAYVLTVTGLFKLMQLELFLIQHIIPADYQKTIFSCLILDSLESVYNEGDQLSARVKRSVQKQDFSSALYLLPVLRYHAYMRHSFDLLLDGCEPQVSDRLHSLVVTLQTTISKTLEEFIEYIKSDSHHHRVPKDGTVHELTSNVMLFLVHLLSYLDILSRVVTVTDIQSLELSGDKNRIAFAQYICRVLSALGLSLRKRSESYHNEPSLQSLFLLNNTYYILKTLTNSSLLPIVLLYRPNVESDYLHQIRDFKKNYQQCWNKVLQFIDLNSTSRRGTLLPNIGSSTPNTVTLPSSFSSYTLSSSSPFGQKNIKDKDRQLIKDKFTGFNKEFEALINSHKSFAIPDKDLRDELKHEHIQLIVPLYHQFYDRYIAIEFTKNVHKYIKYSPDHVFQSITSFFDQLA